MFRRALRLGARVSVASCAVVPATTACLSDSKSQRVEINDFGAVSARVWFGSCISDRDRRHGSPLVKKLAKTAEFWPRLRAGGFAALAECLAANESTYKFKPSVALKRHQSLNDLDVQDDDVALADDTEQVSANDPAENAVAVAVN